MTTPRLLSQEELVELTDYSRPADQRRWLDGRGIPYWIGASGRPKVLWSDLEHSARQTSSEPRWDRLPRTG